MEAVIFAGIQASGKTTFYRERFFETHLRLSLDMLRTRARERILLDACLAARQSFVVDNTNVLASDRAIYIDAARRAGFQVVGFFFRTDARAAIGRNRSRQEKRSIPVAGILAALKRLQPPVLEEGFDRLYTVEIGEGGEFIVT
jgi:predicted kinase